MSAELATQAQRSTGVSSDFNLSVTDVAVEAGVAPSAVRFYEKYGIISGQRTLGNQRRFNEDAGCRIKVAKLAQRVGLTVKEIADLFTQLPENPQPRDWGLITDSLITEAEERVARLKRQLGQLGSDSRLCEIQDDAD